MSPSGSLQAEYELPKRSSSPAKYVLHPSAGKNQAEGVSSPDTTVGTIIVTHVTGVDKTWNLQESQKKS